MSANSRLPGERRGLVSGRSQLRPGVRRGGALHLGVLLALAALPAAADTPLAQAPLAYTQLPDPAQEAAAQRLMAELRCLVCQGQAVSDSDADMAGAMRALVRERIAKGEKPEAIRAWLIERYGDYVTYDPPWSMASAPLWLAPLVLLVLGAWVARSSFRRRRR
jgi:cytochrome c-type biogenesis protein CcmH